MVAGGAECEPNGVAAQSEIICVLYMRIVTPISVAAEVEHSTQLFQVS